MPIFSTIVGYLSSKSNQEEVTTCLSDNEVKHDDVLKESTNLIPTETKQLDKEDGCLEPNECYESKADQENIERGNVLSASDTDVSFYDAEVGTNEENSLEELDDLNNNDKLVNKDEVNNNTANMEVEAEQEGRVQITKDIICATQQLTESVDERLQNDPENIPKNEGPDKKGVHDSEISQPVSVRGCNAENALNEVKTSNRDTDVNTKTSADVVLETQTADLHENRTSDKPDTDVYEIKTLDESVADPWGSKTTSDQLAADVNKTKISGEQILDPLEPETSDQPISDSYENQTSDGPVSDPQETKTSDQPVFDPQETTTSDQPVLDPQETKTSDQPVKNPHDTTTSNETNVTKQNRQKKVENKKDKKAEPLLGLTPEMIEEEKKLKEEQEKQLSEIKEKALAELNRTGQKQRFNRLQVLLSRSQMYSTYILGRLNSRREAEKKRLERTDKKKEELMKAEENKPTEKEVNKVEDQKSRGKRKRKKLDDDKEEVPKTKKQRVSKTKKSDNTKQKGVSPTNEDKQKKLNPIERDKLYYNRTIKDEVVPPLQPLLMTGGILRSYQLEGMTWLLGLFEHGINGILADEMGLGKTLQSISLIASLIERDVKGPFLIAAPLSTLPNWISEFQKFAPEVYTILYHGSIAERAELRRKMMRIKRYSNGFVSLPVIISSYEILMRDRALLETYNIEWKFLIVDEGHRIKNLNCRLIKELKLYRAANRLLLTGTPLQNNLGELWSLLNFLLPDIFDDLNSFQTWFDFSSVMEEDDNEKLIEKEKEDNVLQTLHSILTPFLLRRLKTDVDLSIPPKKEVYVYAPLTEKQEFFYKSTIDRTILDLLKKKHKQEEEPLEYTQSGRMKRKSAARISYEENDNEDFDLDVLLKEAEEVEQRKLEELNGKKKEKPKSVVNIRLQNVMMQLRKCCNHPYLLEYPFNPDTNELMINEELVKASGKMLVLDQMLSALKDRGHKVLIFSQMTLMLDIIGDYCSIRNYKYSRIDGSMDVKLRQENIKDFDKDDENFIFLLSTRAGGLGLNLMMADTCIIYDSDWNPQVDLQAQDRCHRIGQKKPVVIYRFITANTIDQRIVERANNKRKLEKMIIHKKNFKGRSATAVSPAELLELLQSKDVTSSIDSRGKVFTEDDMNKLLDRSEMLNFQKNQSDGAKVNKDVDIDQSENHPFKVVNTAADDDITF